MNRNTYAHKAALILVLLSGVALAEERVIVTESNKAANAREATESRRENPEQAQLAQRRAERACAGSDKPSDCEQATVDQLTNKPSVPTPEDGTSREDTAHGAGGY